MQAYSFTSTPIAKALLEAHKRDVQVQVILDKSQRTEKYSEADFLVNVGIPTRIDAAHQIAHNKIMVIDGADGHHRIVQLYHQRRRAQRRKPAGHPLSGTGGQVHGELGSSCCPFRTLRGRTEGYSQTHRTTGHTDPVVPAAAASGGYVTSRNSEVFHRADCKSAAKISAKNLVRYASRDEAIRAGKKPCHECNP